MAVQWLEKAEGEKYVARPGIEPRGPGFDTRSGNTLSFLLPLFQEGPGFDTRSGNILLFLLPLFQEGQLSVTGESMCTKYWLTA